MQASGWIQLALYRRRARGDHQADGALSHAGARRERQDLARPGPPAAGAAHLSPDGRRRRSKEQDWKQYTLAMLLFSLVSCLFTYAILRLQHLLPLNPQGLGRVERRIWRSTPPSVSPPTPTGRATAANPRCRISRRWSGWRSTTSSPPPPASPSPRRSCAASRGTRPRRSATSGWTSCASTYYLLLPDLPRVRRVPRVAGHDSELQALHEGQAGRADEDLGREEERQGRDRSSTRTASRSWRSRP